MSEKSDKAIRILIADASRITTMGIRQVLEKEPDFEIVGMAADGEEAVAKTNELEPDVLVIEVDLPRLSGIKATQRVRRELPAVGVVILRRAFEQSVPLGFLLFHVRAEWQDRRHLDDVHDCDRRAVVGGEPARDVHRAFRLDVVRDRDEQVAEAERAGHAHDASDARLEAPLSVCAGP